MTKCFLLGGGSNNKNMEELLNPSYSIRLSSDLTWTLDPHFDPGRRLDPFLF